MVKKSHIFYLKKSNNKIRIHTVNVDYFLWNSPNWRKTTIVQNVIIISLLLIYILNMSIYCDIVKYLIIIVSKNNLFCCMYFLCSLIMTWRLIRSNFIIFLVKSIIPIFFQFTIQNVNKNILQLFLVILATL